MEAGGDVRKVLQFMGVLIRMPTTERSRCENVNEKIFEADLMGVD